MTLFSLLLSACTEAKFAVVNIPAITYDGVITKNVAYGDLPRLTLDIYQPETIKQTLPVIVFFHGGRWSFGDKDQYKFVGMTLSKMGYVVVMPNTRLYPDVKHPVFVEDATGAIAWVHKNINQYNGQSSNLFLSGHSSGAHIASLVIADNRYLAKHDLKPSIVSAFAGLSGPYDFIPEADDLKDIFGPPSNYPTMQISTYIDGDEPPMLFLHGRKDKAVILRNLRLAREAIERNNGIVESHVYPDADHVDTVAALSWVNPANLDVASHMDQFFRQFLN